MPKEVDASWIEDLYEEMMGIEFFYLPKDLFYA